MTPLEASSDTRNGMKNIHISKSMLASNGVTIFNSLGSNYDLAFALRAECALGSKKTRQQLIDYLNERYGGKTTLTYKGRDAITLALKALLPHASGTVAINGFTCIALYDAVVQAGMAPVLLDIEKGALDFSARALEDALAKDSSIKAVIIQNTLGYPCEGNKIAAICKERGIFLIEDLAHSVGARYADGSEAGLRHAEAGFGLAEAGTLGDATVLSFGQDKAVDAVSGGALVLRNAMIAQVEMPQESVPFKQQLKDRFYPRFTWDIRSTYRWYGRLEHTFLRAVHALPRPLEGGHGPRKLPHWYTPLILRQFLRLDTVSEHRRSIARIYAKMLDTSVTLPGTCATIDTSANLRFPIVVNDRAELIAHMRERGVHVSDTWYDAPIAPKKYSSRVRYQKGTCPNAEFASERILNLPTHINVSPHAAKVIADEVNRFLKHEHGI